MNKRMTVGLIARRVGMQPSAVRFYERCGLITAGRLPNGYRVYGQDALTTLRFISRAKRFGFSLSEIKDILTVRRRGTQPCGCVKAMIEQHLEDIERRIRMLSRLKRELRALNAKPETALSPESICPIIESY